jgi:hypothetical protein
MLGSKKGTTCLEHVMHSKQRVRSENTFARYREETLEKQNKGHYKQERWCKTKYPQKKPTNAHYGRREGVTAKFGGSEDGHEVWGTGRDLYSFRGHVIEIDSTRLDLGGFSGY